MKKIFFSTGNGFKVRVLPKINNLVSFFKGLWLNFVQQFSIRNRLIFFFLSISLIPISIIGFISYSSSRDAINRKISQYSIDGLAQAVLNMQIKLKQFEDASDKLYSRNNQFKSSLKSLIDEPDDAKAMTWTKTVGSYFNEEMLSNADIFACLFIADQDDNRSIVITRDYEKDFYRFTVEIKKTALYQNIAKAGGDIVWSPAINLARSHFVLLGRYIEDQSTGTPLGVLAIVMDEEKLDRITNLSLYNKLSIDMGEMKNYSLVVNNEGAIISSPIKENIGFNISQFMKSKQPIMQKILESKVSDRDYGNDVNQGSLEGEVDHQKVLVTYKSVGSQIGIGGKSGWHVLSIALTSFLYREADAVGFITLVLGLIFGVVAVFFSLTIAFGISRPLGEMMAAMKRAENGDLTARVLVSTRDELGILGVSFNHMIEKIRRLIVDTRQVIEMVLERSTALEISSDQSVQTAESVSEAMEQITVGTMEQTTETEKSSLQMNGLANQIDQVVTKAGEVEEITDSTRLLSLQSKESVQQLIEKTNETGRITNIIYNDIHDLNESAEEIRNITEVISGIAEQTNLLALNAAIEAARAGEMGRGFAVVADEVNRLAAQSREAAQTINSILQTIEDKAKVSTMSVAQANQIVREQIKAVQTAQKSFDEIITAMDQAVRKITDMNEMIGKINDAKEQTVHSIGNISTISQETAASAEEVSVSSEEQTSTAGQVKLLAIELRRKAEELVEVIEKFQVG
jgi:methyl-accepting chemotaxis protein